MDCYQVIVSLFLFIWTHVVNDSSFKGRVIREGPVLCIFGLRAFYLIQKILKFMYSKYIYQDIA